MGTVLLFIILIIVGNMLNQSFLQYCATNPVSLPFMFGGYISIVLLMVVVFFVIRMIFSSNKDEYKHHINTENINENFKNLYNRLKAENFRELEALRKKVMIQEFGACFGLFLAISVFFAVGVVLKNVTNDLVITFSGYCKAMPFVGIFIAILFLSWGEKYKKDYVKIYKENILPSFIKLINPNLEYYYKKHEKYEDYKPYNVRTEIENEYLNADFDGSNFDYIEEEDWVKGQIEENNFFKVTDIKVYEEYIDGDGDRRRRAHFKGLFLSIENNKNIETCLKININQNNQIEGAEKYQVTMDSSEFEDIFDVYCDDKVLAMRILTTDVMELIMNFYKKYYILFEICYRNNKIYTRFFVENMFEPGTITSSMDIKSLYMYYAIVEFAMNFSREINKLADDVEI